LIDPATPLSKGFTIGELLATSRPGAGAAMRRLGCTIRVLAALVVLAPATGCAIRLNNVEHFVGPVLFRTMDSGATGAAITQVVQLGIWAEVGRQWGVASGMASRIAVAPSPSAGEQSPMRWTMPITPWWVPSSGDCALSLFYLRGEHVPSPLFLRRVLVGAAATSGVEGNAVSVGYVARSHFAPPTDAASVLRFHSDRPMETRLVVWPSAKPGQLPVENILKEMNREPT